MRAIRRIPLPSLTGLVLTALFVLAAIFAPLIAPHGNAEIVGDVWEPMSAAHWLGTDNLGRDLLSRMIYGARITLFIAVLATALSFSLGAILGFSAAVFGGWYDTILSRLVDLLMSIPTLIMGLVVLSVLPSNLVTLILVMGILDSTRVY
ncbi:MAG: ABC transporter permease, partial [Mesorhizobium sp.]